MNNLDSQYKQLISQVLRYGSTLETRGTKSIYMFGTSIRHDLRDGFPAITLRNVYPLSAIKEMLIWDLQSYGLIDHPGLSKGLRKVWSNYDNGNGYVSNSYSRNWRAWPGQANAVYQDPRGNLKSTQTDQILKLVYDIRNNPTSRSHVLQAYNPGAKDSMPHCHPSAVFSSDGQCLDLLVMGRSNDLVGGGMAGDLCRYGALLQAMGQTTMLEPRYLQITNANLHIYEADINDAKELLYQKSHELPTLKLKFESIVGIDPKDIELVNYKYSKFTKTGSLTLGDLSSYGV